MTDFDKCTITKIDSERVSVECCLGLWSVSFTRPMAGLLMEQSRYMFDMYNDDGEYNELLRGDL